MANLGDLKTKTYLIYKHTSPSVKSYIGQTCNYKARIAVHKNCPDCSVFYKAIKKYTWESFTHQILKDDLSVEEANFWEKAFIEEHNTLIPFGYNLRTGGDNYRLSEETKFKIGLANTGKKRTEEQLQKMSVIASMRTNSEETRLKISLGNKGRKFTKEHREKISLARKNLSVEARLNLSIAGKKRPPITEETREKLIIARICYKHSEETKLKIAEGNKRRTYSEETKLKMSNSQKNRSPITEETRLKMSLSHTGSKRSEEVRQKMKEAQILRYANFKT